LPRAISTAFARAAEARIRLRACSSSNARCFFTSATSESQAWKACVMTPKRSAPFARSICRIAVFKIVPLSCMTASASFLAWSCVFSNFPEAWALSQALQKRKAVEMSYSMKRPERP